MRNLFFIGSLIPALLIASCSNPLKPKQQKLLRVWSGPPGAERMRIACGIPKDNTTSYLNQGWKIISTKPYSYSNNSVGGSYMNYGNCIVSEIVIEK